MCSAGLLHGVEALRAAAELRGADSTQHGRVRHVRGGVIPRRLPQRQARLRQRRVVQLSGRHLHRLASHRHHIRHDTRRRHRYTVTSSLLFINAKNIVYHTS